MPPIKTKTSVGLETPDQTVERANKLLQPTISASDLTAPTTPITVPEPQVGSLPQGTSQIVSNVTRDMNGFIAAQTQESADLKKRQQEYAQLTNQGSLQDLFTSTMEGAGVNQNTLKELKDIQLQLTDNKTASELTKTQIAGADGQTLAQGQREITQEDRESAVRSAGLAARASVIQGNIETATQLARDTVNIAYQDRTLTSQNLLNQIEQLQGQVDDQTGQLLEQEKRQYEADLAAVEELKKATQDAIVSGASQSEISQLTDPNVDDQTKLQLAQSITARGATEMRNLEIQDIRSSISARNAGVAQGWARIDMEERKFNYQQQQDALEAELESLQKAGAITEEQAANQKKVEQALQLQDLTQQIRGHAGFNLSVGSLGSRIFSVTEGGLAGQAWNYLSGQGEGFDALYDQLTDSLTLDNLDKMSGVLTDKDIEILRGAAVRLRKTTSEDEFLGVLDDMDSVFQRTIDENGITPQQARFYYGTDDETLNEIDQIWGNTTVSSGSQINFDY